MLARLPATSVAVAVRLPTPETLITLVPRLTPGVFVAPELVGWQPEGDAMPEPAAPLNWPLGSEQLNVTVMSLRYQLFRPSGTAGAKPVAEMVGGVRSSRTGP